MQENPKARQGSEQKEDAVAVATRDIEYGADGTTMVGRLALPGGSGKRPAVLIAHDGPGLTDHQRGRADRLAELGYVAFALDYHGGGRFISDPDEMLARLGELGPTRSARARSASPGSKCSSASRGSTPRR